MLLQGKLRQAVRWVTGQDKGVLLQPTNTCSKTGLPVEEVFLSKHPSPTQPSEDAHVDYDTLPAIINIDVTEDTVENAASKMQGTAGPGEAYGIHQLCSGLKAGTEGAVHFMMQIWDEHAE
eukprot:15059899-Ditylum_brightwellii.AAC.1